MKVDGYGVTGTASQTNNHVEGIEQHNQVSDLDCVYVAQRNQEAAHLLNAVFAET